MTEQTDQTPEVLELSPEQASTNFYWLFGKSEVFNLQTTIRGILDPLQIQAHLESAKMMMKEIVEMGGHAKQVGKQDQPAPRPDPAHANGATQMMPPPPSLDSLARTARTKPTA